MKKLLIMAVVAALFLTNCSKESDPDPVKAKTKTELLTASPWKATSITISPGIDFGGGVLITDFFAQMESCEKDDLTKYDANKTGVYDDGATKCDPKDPQTNTFTWSFDLSETKITEDGETLDIEELTETTLKYSLVMDGADLGGTAGIKYKFTVTFKH
jgi:hypothetical protein